MYVIEKTYIPYVRLHLDKHHHTMQESSKHENAMNENMREMKLAGSGQINILEIKYQKFLAIKIKK